MADSHRGIHSEKKHGKRFAYNRTSADHRHALPRKIFHAVITEDFSDSLRRAGSERVFVSAENTRKRSVRHAVDILSAGMSILILPALNFFGSGLKTSIP